MVGAVKGAKSGFHNENEVGKKLKMPELIFKGIAHPPAKATRDHPADLSVGEMVGTQAAGLPVHIEHETSQNAVGDVLASWQGARGELRVMGRVTDAATAERVKNGDLRGLSLGTDCVQSMDGTVLSRAQRELSLCEEGRRAGTWITELNGQKVHEVACFSRKGARAR